MVFGLPLWTRLCCALVATHFIHAQPIGIAPSQLTATESLQTVIDRGGPLVYVPKGNYELTVPLKMRSGLIVQFEPGTSVIAAAGKFTRVNDCLIVFERTDTVVFNADGCTFAMRKSDYRDVTKYQASEWRHCLDLRGAKNITINGGTYSDSGGDGIRIGQYTDLTTNPVTWIPCDNIAVRRATFNSCNRNGVSVVSGKRVLIEDCILSNNAGISPMAGFDAEPNDGADPIEVTLRRCSAISNRGPAYIVALQRSKLTTAPIKIAFENCAFSGVPADQISVYMTIFSPVDKISTDGYMAGNIPVGSSIRWNDLEWKK